MHRFVVPLIVFVAAGCAAVTTLDGRQLRVGSEAFRDYVEKVFREQNRTASRLAFALESEGLSADAADALSAAETSLLDACAGLNEIATSRRDNRSLGKLRQLNAARQAPECERATHGAQQALRRESED
jgi:hypothetical protein